MEILKSLRGNLVDLELDRVWEGFDEPDDGLSPAQLDELKRRTLWELADLLCRSGSVGNKNKLFTDLHNREKKAPTAIGMGIAFPHVRTMQVKQFVAGVARSARGIPFAAPDDKSVHLFFVMAAPPYDDKSYLRAYKALAGALRFDTVRTALLASKEPHELIQVLRHSV